MATHAAWFRTDHLDWVVPAPDVARHESNERATTEMLGVWLLLGTLAGTTLAMAAAILWVAPGVAAGAAFASALWR